MKTYSDFPIGQRVRLVKNRTNSEYCCCDFHVFCPGETGVVVENDGEYLGIRVKLDHVVIDGNGPYWGFNPEHLEPVLKSAYGKDMVEV